MNKYLRVAVTALALVMVAQWFVFSRLRRENQLLRDAREQAEQSRLELAQTVASTKNHQAEAEALRIEAARLRGQAQPARQELEPVPASERPPAIGDERLTVAEGRQPVLPLHRDSYILATTNVDAASLRVIGPERGANLLVRLVGVSSDEIEAVAGIRPCDIIVDGQVIAKSATRWQHGGTNIGLVLVFDTRAQAEATAAALRGVNTQ